MLTAFPLLVIPVVVYAIYAMTSLTGTTATDPNFMLQSALMTVNMPSGGTWTMGVGDLLVFFGLIFLFFELLKSTSSQRVAIINHALSMGLLVLCLILFLLLPSFATATFFLITMMVLLDVMAGFIVTIMTARRDLDIGGDAQV
jgi:signal transduction histidine kinase